MLAIIPARGGSKGVPRKNVRPLAGKPLIGYTIEHAKASKAVDRIIVSTDDDEIAAVSRDFGAEVLIRPKELATDQASSESALAHVLSKVSRPEWVLFLQCTSPIRHQTDIDRAFDLLLQEKSDSLLSACKSHTFLWRKGPEGWGALNYEPAKRMRRQDMPLEMAENGSFYIFRPSVLERTGSRLGGRISIYEMDYWTSFQIDTPEDFELCEWILGRRGPSAAAR